MPKAVSIMTGSGTVHEKTQAFLAVATQFRLGELPTEQPHPLTSDLSELAKQDPGHALDVLHAVDSRALAVLAGPVQERIILLAHRIHTTLASGNSVYLCGCGSTGRLSLACESLWHRWHRDEAIDGKVISFMAGGDAALVTSIEDFEDHPEYGARQLTELGFCNGDLLISSTEGGETPFVIGATLCAAEKSVNPPFFLYCNPDDILCRVAERSLRVIRDSRIEKINLTVGPMAITGSTRMQASTVLMAAVGSALLWHAAPEKIRPAIESVLDSWQGTDPSFLADCIVREAECYHAGGHLEYLTDRDLAVTILTDTTERSPTFSMPPFENILGPDTSALRSPIFLFMPEAGDSAAAWEMILGRRPRTLDWEHIRGIASYERLLGFDFSGRSLKLRQERLSRCFSIRNFQDHISFEFEFIRYRLSTRGTDLLTQHLILKMLLNMHSTLVMGRLGRFEGNVMTWVKASNCKLVDRTVRYADCLLKKKGVTMTFEQLVNACFELQDKIAKDQSLVHALVRQFAG
jgi:N-acetylmuramic acid 6-phosphate etherase